MVERVGKGLTASYKLDEAIIRLAEIKRRTGEVTHEDIEVIIGEYRFGKTKNGVLIDVVKWEGTVE